ncbi:MAG: hypothetical protein WBC90_14935 [Albidovulum sp.]
MNESIFVAAMMVILAFAGGEPSHAQSAKVCKVSSVANFLSSC